MLRLTVGQRMAVGLVLPAIAVTEIGGIGYFSTANLISNSERGTHTHEVLGNIELLMSMMKDVETGSRGFAISGEDKYLEPYEAAIPRVDPTFNKLKTLTKDNPTQQRRLDTLRRCSRHE